MVLKNNAVSRPVPLSSCPLHWKGVGRLVLPDLQHWKIPLHQINYPLGCYGQNPSPFHCLNGMNGAEQKPEVGPKAGKFHLKVWTFQQVLNGRWHRNSYASLTIVVSVRRQCKTHFRITFLSILVLSRIRNILLLKVYNFLKLWPAAASDDNQYARIPSIGGNKQRRKVFS